MSNQLPVAPFTSLFRRVGEPQFNIHWPRKTRGRCLIDGAVVPVIIKGRPGSIDTQSALQSARDAGVTHVIIESLVGDRIGHLQLGACPVSNFTSDRYLTRTGRRDETRTGNVSGGFSVVDSNNIAIPERTSVEEAWSDDDARWHWHMERTDFTFHATKLLWDLLGREVIEDGGRPLEFLDIALATVGGPSEQTWGPLWLSKSSFSRFSSCFQIERASDCKVRWVVSSIHIIDNWYVGRLEDITPLLTEFQRKLKFEVPETQGCRIRSRRPEVRAGVFLVLPDHGYEATAINQASCATATPLPASEEAK